MCLVPSTRIEKRDIMMYSISILPLTGIEKGFERETSTDTPLTGIEKFEP